MSLLDAAETRPLEGGPSFSLGNRAVRVFWQLSWLLLARWTPPPLHAWRNMILRVFGAQIGKGVRFHASAQVWLPKNLSVGDYALIGPHVRIYNQGHIAIGARTVISQHAHICASSHDLKDPHFQLVLRPIKIGDDVWVAADAFVGPGVAMGCRSVLSARGVLFQSAEVDTIYSGNPAVPLRHREPLSQVATTSNSLQAKPFLSGLRIEVWHNIMWSNYKASVFSSLDKLSNLNGCSCVVYQIAETDIQRASLTKIDLSFHNYKYKLLFKGGYESTPLWRRLAKLGWLAATTRADIVVVAGYHRPEFILQGLILKLRGVPRAVFCDSTAYDRPKNWFKALAKRFSFWLLANVLCYGARAREYVVSFGIKPDRAFLRCQAAALPANYDPAAVLKVRRKLARSAADPVFIYVGRLAEEKSLHTLIEAFPQVLALAPNARLKLIGSGPLKDELAALIEKNGLSNQIELTGPKEKDDLYNEYLNAFAMVLPSWSEPWGLVVNEALHFGCPVIVSHRCGCVPELVDCSESGLVFEAGSVDHLASQMCHALSIWGEGSDVAAAAMAKIAPFSSDNAAAAILSGIDTILRSEKDAITH